MTELHEVACQCSVERIPHVGPVRAMRLERDLGVTTVSELAQLSREELQQIWSIGPVRSAQIAELAQVHMDGHEDQTNEFGHEEYIAVYVPGPVESDEADSILDEAGLNREEKFAAIDSAVARSGADPVESDIRIITHSDAPDIVTEWYDNTVWHHFQNERDSEFTLDRVETPWDKFDSGVNWKAAKARNVEVVAKANKVVIVADGPYMDTLRELCETKSTSWETTWRVRGEDADEVGLLEWDPERTLDYDFRGFDLTDTVESWIRTANTNSGPGSHIINSGDRLHKESDSDDEAEDADVDFETANHVRAEMEDAPREGGDIEMSDDDLPDGMTRGAGAAMTEMDRVDQNDLNDGDPGGGLEDEYYDSTT